MSSIAFSLELNLRDLHIQLVVFPLQRGVIHRYSKLFPIVWLKLCRVRDIIREGTISKAGGYVRGVVKTFDSERGIGIICGENGGKYPVTLADVIKLQPLAAGQLVHFSVRFVNNHAFATDVGIRQADPKGIS